MSTSKPPREIESGLSILDTLPAVLTRNPRRPSRLPATTPSARCKADMHGHYLQDALARDDQAEVDKAHQAAAGAAAGRFGDRAGDGCLLHQAPATTRRPTSCSPPIEQRLRDKLNTDPTGQGAEFPPRWYLARSCRKLDEAMKLATHGGGRRSGKRRVHRHAWPRCISSSASRMRRSSWRPRP